MAETRRATAADCEPGAVLMIGGEFWDVVGWKSGNMRRQLRLINDFGEERDITESTVRSYMLVRPAPRFTLPTLDAATDKLRRSGIFANLDAA